MTRKLLIFIAFLFGFSTISGQKRYTSYEDYIEKYADMAIDQMQRFGIPASITLAQGLLESAAGKSRLAIEANNHFGIKVGTGWTGPYVLKDDDNINDKFRKYNSVEESFEDHSHFLADRKRYASLFQLSTTDYKGWAHGLKSCGYATSPTYAQNLINIIETYELTQYDTGLCPTTRRSLTKLPSTTTVTTKTITTYTPIVRVNNGVPYVIAKEGDTWKTLAKRYDKTVRCLCRYNQLDKHYQLKAGDIVYLKKKPRRAAKIYKKQYHLVRANESMHLISQRYGMKMQTLYKLNKLPEDYMPRVGDKLRLR